MFSSSFHKSLHSRQAKQGGDIILDQLIELVKSDMLGGLQVFLWLFNNEFHSV